LTAHLFISTASKVVLFDAKTNSIMLFTNKEYITGADPGGGAPGAPPPPLKLEKI
jgi:hypothetical protein